MTAQGSCVLPSDESGRVLDRLAALEQVISAEAVGQACAAGGRTNSRACKLSHEVTLWVVLAMGLLTDLPIRQVFKHCRRMRSREKTVGRAALCHARQRLGVSPLRELFQATVRPLAQPHVPGGFYRGLRLVAIDGTVLDLPDTEANDKAFGRPQAGDRGAGAFPQVRKLSLVEIGTHVELAFVAKTIRRNEQKLVAGLLKHLKADMLLLWDRGFFSYELWKEVVATGVKVLARVTSHAILKPIANLSDGSYLAKIYPSAHDRAKDRHGVVVRVIRYKLDDPQRTGDGEVHVLITNLMDHAEDPALTLIEAYHERWEHEIVYDEQKTHQDPRRITKPTHLRSQTPAGVMQEIYALSLAHFAVRSFMYQAAERTKTDPDRLSFTGCLQVLRCRLPECDTKSPASFKQWYDVLLEELANERIPARRNRINPRVIKRKMSHWNKTRPEHRKLPPLKKTFRETIVMTN